MQRRTAEAMQLINQSKQAKLQEQLAQTMESFQIGDDASTFNEMRDKIDRRAAAAEAKMQLGAASVDNADAGHRARSDGYATAGQAACLQTRHGTVGQAQRPTPQALPAEGRNDGASNNEKGNNGGIVVN
jgi:phage shock protein A